MSTPTDRRADPVQAPAGPARLITVPSSDVTFRELVARAQGRHRSRTPTELEDRLRRLFPRVIVRARALSGETPSWYVYRDGGWRHDASAAWWEEAGVPSIATTLDGWLTRADPMALSLLAIDASELGTRHFTDFVVPGTLEDAGAIFAIVSAGNDLTATLVLRPADGDAIPVDVHAAREGDAIVGRIRLADDVEADLGQGAVAIPRPALDVEPASDAAFGGYVERCLDRMPEPTPEGLAMRLRRLYPHARVEDRGGGRWRVHRDAPGAAVAASGWWRDDALPWVRYDRQALILEANEAAASLLGHHLVGHYWQEFVTPGSTEQVSEMLAILERTGGAESRFRMPGPDGALVDLDSWTEVDGESFTTVLRSRPREVGGGP